MKKILFLLSLLIIGFIADAQIDIKNYTWYRWFGRHKFDTSIRVPLDTFASAPAGSLAFKNNKFFVKDTFLVWQNVALTSIIETGAIDSIKISSSVSADTLKYWISGIPYVAGIIETTTTTGNEFLFGNGSGGITSSSDFTKDGWNSYIRYSRTNFTAYGKNNIGTTHGWMGIQPTFNGTSDTTTSLDFFAYNLSGTDASGTYNIQRHPLSLKRSGYVQFPEYDDHNFNIGLDTTNYKIAVLDSNGVVHESYWPTGGGGGDVEVLNGLHYNDDDVLEFGGEWTRQYTTLGKLRADYDLNQMIQFLNDTVSNNYVAFTGLYMAPFEDSLSGIQQSFMYGIQTWTGPGDRVARVATVANNLYGVTSFGRERNLNQEIGFGYNLFTHALEDGISQTSIASDFNEVTDRMTVNDWQGFHRMDVYTEDSVSGDPWGYVSFELTGLNGVAGFSFYQEKADSGLYIVSPQFYNTGDYPTYTLPVSVNGQFADGFGNITIEAGGGLLSKGKSLEFPTSTENSYLWQTDVDITVSSVTSVLVGSSTPSVTFNIAFGTNRTSATNVFSSGQVTTSTTSGHTFNSGFNDATIPAGSFIWLTTSAQSGTVEEIGLTINYTED